MSAAQSVLIPALIKLAMIPDSKVVSKSTKLLGLIMFKLGEEAFQPHFDNADEEDKAKIEALK